jgi:hypothetical protein
MDNSNSFFETMTFNPWAILDTWLNLGASPKLQENYT